MYFPFTAMEPSGESPTICQNFKESKRVYSCLPRARKKGQMGWRKKKKYNTVLLKGYKINLNITSKNYKNAFE